MSSALASLLASIMAFYDNFMQPISFLASFGIFVSPLDVVGAFRLALVLRQLRELFHGEHVKKLKAAGGGTSGRPGKDLAEVERRARTRDLVTTFVMVYGGEAVVAPWLGIQPSFMLGGTIPATFVVTHLIVEALPAVPSMNLYYELPLAPLDALTRAPLLCNFIPAMITKHASPLVSSSPWTLLLTALFTANGGFFFANMFSLLQPHAMTLTTPPELLPWGWTATDLWVAPLVTALYATLTHAQPFFADLHNMMFPLFNPLGLAPLSFKSMGMHDKTPSVGELMAVDPDTARAACVVVLSIAFITRTMKTFAPQSLVQEGLKEPVPRERDSIKTPRKNYTGASKKQKTQ